VPGFVVVVARHGKVVYLDSTGFMDIEHARAMRSDAVFRIFSMTKPITTVAVMQLVERGKLRLDDPVSKYIPAFAGTRVYLGGGAANPQLGAPARPITIEALLTHTAGLTYGAFGNTPVDSIYRRANLLDASRTLAQFADSIARLPLLFSPGSAWNYSFAMDVLGRVVEVVSGKPLDRYFQDEILGPLGMRSTAFRFSSAMTGHVPVAYGSDGSGKLAPVQLDASYQPDARIFYGGGGLLSTIDDYLRFTQALLNGGELDGHRVLEAKTVATMMQNHLPAALTPMPSTGGYPPGHYGFGYGGAVRVDSESSVPGNAGTYRWSGYASTFFWIDPKADLVAMIWTQYAPSPAVFGMDGDFQRLVYAALEGGKVSAR
jgi:CubicO group peptidase (beta-lactamase class C family)